MFCLRRQISNVSRRFKNGFFFEMHFCIMSVFSKLSFFFAFFFNNLCLLCLKYSSKYLGYVLMAKSGMLSWEDELSVRARIRSVKVDFRGSGWVIFVLILHVSIFVFLFFSPWLDHVSQGNLSPSSAWKMGIWHLEANCVMKDRVSAFNTQYTHGCLNSLYSHTHFTN